MKSRTTFAILLALSTTAALNAQSYETTKADAAAKEDAVEGKPIVQPNLMVTGTVLEIDDIGRDRMEHMAPAGYVTLTCAVEEAYDQTPGPLAGRPVATSPR